MSDTPKTDSFVGALIYFDVSHARLANFARELEIENSALRAAHDKQIAFLMAQNAALRADKDRLDWLETVQFIEGIEPRTYKCIDLYSPIRQSIDAAMKETKK